MRILAGTLLSLLAIGTILLIFSTADTRVPVVQLVRDVPAGRQITADDLRLVELSVDASVEVVAGADQDLVVGQYAKVRMLAGGLLQRANLQDGPLVAAGAAVVAVIVPPGAIPVGLEERSRVQLVFPVEAGSTGPLAKPVEGRVVALPTAADEVTGELSVSVEVPAASAASVAAAPDVRLVLLDPGGEP